MRFLNDHTRQFFVTTSPDGQKIWDRLKATTCFVVATPNGWEDFQRGYLRQDLILAEALPTRNPRERFIFVTESEASILHHYDERGPYCVNADTNLYKVVTAARSLVLEEV